MELTNTLMSATDLSLPSHSFSNRWNMQKKYLLGFEKTKTLQKMLFITIFFQTQAKKKKSTEEMATVLPLSFLVLSKWSLLRQNPCWCKGRPDCPRRSSAPFKLDRCCRTPSGRAATTTCEQVRTPCTQGELCLTIPLPCIYFLWFYLPFPIF